MGNSLVHNCSHLLLFYFLLTMIKRKIRGLNLRTRSSSMSSFGHELPPVREDEEEDEEPEACCIICLIVT